MLQKSIKKNFCINYFFWFGAFLLQIDSPINIHVWVMLFWGDYLETKS